MKKYQYYYIPSRYIVWKVTARAIEQECTITIVSISDSERDAIEKVESLCRLNGPQFHWGITVEEQELIRE